MRDNFAHFCNILALLSVIGKESSKEIIYIMNNKSKTNKNKLVLDVYEQPIYIPNKVYVLKNYTQKDIDKYFEYADGDSINLKDMNEFKALTISGCVEKKTGRYCIIVLLSEALVTEFKKDIPEGISVCAHEAFHSASRILEWCHIKLAEESEETYAFMVGWATKCIFNTLKK